MAENKPPYDPRKTWAQGGSSVYPTIQPVLDDYVADAAAWQRQQKLKPKTYADYAAEARPSTYYPVPDTPLPVSITPLDYARNTATYGDRALRHTSNKVADIFASPFTLAYGGLNVAGDALGFSTRGEHAALQEALKNAPEKDKPAIQARIDASGVPQGVSIDALNKPPAGWYAPGKPVTNPTTEAKVNPDGTVPAFTLPSAGSIQAQQVEMADFQPYYEKIKGLYGDVAPEAEARLKEREARLQKAEKENVGDRLIEFGLGMLGKNDFYRAMGESGQQAFGKYGEEKKAARTERDTIDDKRLALDLQNQQMRAQAINAGLGQAQAETGVRGTNAQLSQAAAIANQNAQLDMAKINAMYANALSEASVAGDKVFNEKLKYAFRVGVGTGTGTAEDVLNRAAGIAKASMTPQEWAQALPIFEQQFSTYLASPVPTQSGTDISVLSGQ